MFYWKISDYIIGITCVTIMVHKCHQIQYQDMENTLQNHPDVVLVFCVKLLHMPCTMLTLSGHLSQWFQSGMSEPSVSTSLI